MIALIGSLYIYLAEKFDIFSNCISAIHY